MDGSATCYPWPSLNEDQIELASIGFLPKGIVFLNNCKKGLKLLQSYVSAMFYLNTQMGIIYALFLFWKRKRLQMLSID